MNQKDNPRQRIFARNNVFKGEIISHQRESKYPTRDAIVKNRSRWLDRDFA